MNKTDKKEGLLKRFKNIESKSNNQLLALTDINRPAIRGRDDDDDDDEDDDDVNNEYKKITEDYKNDKIGYKEIKEKLYDALMQLMLLIQLKYIKKINKCLKIFLILKVR